MRAWIIGTHGTNRAMIRPTQHAWDRMLPFRRAINQNTVWVLNGSGPISRGMMMTMPRTGSMWQGGTKGARQSLPSADQCQVVGWDRTFLQKTGVAVTDRRLSVSIT